MITALAFLAAIAAAVPQHTERFPLGALGGAATVTAGAAGATVVDVTPDAPAARAGLRPGDVIVAVAGVLFAPHTAAVDDGGNGPQRSLGEAIDGAGDGVDATARQLALTVVRGEQRLEVTVALQPRPSLAGPRRDVARAELRAAAATQLLGALHADGFWDSPVGLTGDRVLTAWALVALLAHGDPTHRQVVDRAADWLRGPDGKAWLPDDFSSGPDSLDNWALTATSVALAEHHLANPDDRDVAVIARCNAALAARIDAAGRFGHDVPVGYDGKGFNVINAQAQLAWALGAEAGVPIDEAVWELSLAQLRDSVDADGGVRYWTLPNTGTSDASLRTGAFALALLVTDRAPELRAQLVAYLDAHAARVREAHAVGSLGMLVQAAALQAADRAAYERFVDEWRWYLALLRGPDDRLTYIGGKGNNGGDSYLGFDRIACIIALQVLACADGRLRMLQQPQRARDLRHDQVDAIEAKRIIAQLSPSIGEPRAEDWFEEFRELLGSDEAGALLERWPRGIEGWRHQRMLGAIHRQLRAAHIPALCALASDADADLGEAALRILGTAMIAFTDQHREVIARAYLTRTRGDAAITAKIDGYPPLLASCLEQSLLSGQPEREGEWRPWLWRWARSATAGSTDRELLRRLAATEEFFARLVANAGLGSLPNDAGVEDLRGLRATLANAGEPMLELVALTQLARHGDPTAIADLATRASHDKVALAASFTVDAAAALDRVERALHSDDDADAERVFEMCVEQPLAFYGIVVGAADLRGLRPRLLARNLDARRLARAVGTIPGCRDTALAQRAATDAELLERPDAHALAQGQLGAFLAFLEVIDRPALERLLRAWTTNADEEVRDVAARSLLRLANVDDAARLLTWFAEDRARDEDLRRLGRLRAPAVEQFLHARLAVQPDDRAAMAALAVFHGLPSAVEWVEHVADARLAEVRELLLAGRAADALALDLAGRMATTDDAPAPTLVGLVRDPRVAGYLQALRQRRELGLYAWATGQLTLAGDATARAESWTVFREGRYRWVDDTHPRILTLGHELPTLAFWIEEYESNCCRAVVAEAVFADLFGVEFDRAAGPPVQQARQWWQTHGAGVVWSELAGGYVPGPDGS